MGGRVVLHSDLNNCYASIECMLHPELRGKFMLSDDEVMESLEMQMDFFQMARCLYVPPELLDFKLRILQRQGIKINAPYIAHGDFLKRDLGQPLN